MRRFARFNDFRPFGAAFRTTTTTPSSGDEVAGEGPLPPPVEAAEPLVKVTDAPIDGVKIVALNNGKVNILTPPLLQQLLKALDDACGMQDNGPPSCRGIILTSENAGVFSSGLDLNVLCTNLSQETFVHYWNQFQQLFIALHTLPVPLIAAINGHAPAAGCILALGSDFRVMAREHPLNHKPLTIGIGATRAGFVVPPYVGWSLAHCVGQRRAEQMLQQGKLYTAEEARQIGLVDVLVDNVDEVLLPALEEMERYLDMPGAHSYWLVKDRMRRPLLRALASHELRVADCATFFEMLSLPDVRRDMSEYVASLSKKSN